MSGGLEEWAREDFTARRQKQIAHFGRLHIATSVDILDDVTQLLLDMEADGLALTVPNWQRFNEIRTQMQSLLGE